MRIKNPEFMEESDLEIENVFDDNIKVSKAALKDVTNRENIINKQNTLKSIEETTQITKIKEKSSNLKVLRKYNINFDYEEDKRTNDYNNKLMDLMSDHLHIQNSFTDNLENKENVVGSVFEEENVVGSVFEKENVFTKDQRRRQVLRNVKEYFQDTKKKKDSLEFVDNKNCSDDNKEMDNEKFMMYAGMSKDENVIGRCNTKNEVLRNRDINTEIKLNNTKIKIPLREEFEDKLTFNASNSILHEIQKEFDDLKNSHKIMLQVRNKLLILLENEIQIIKEECNRELTNKYTIELEKYKQEAEYYKSRFSKYKTFCSTKILEYKDKIIRHFTKKRSH